MNYIFCDGGLANRLNTLIAGLVIKQTTATPWTVAWPRNWACGAAFEQLFQPMLPVVEHPLRYFKRWSRNFTFLFHENQIGFPEERILYHKNHARLEDLQRIIATGQPVVYFHNVIPDWVDDTLFAEQVTKIKAVNDIQARVDKFLKDHKITKETIGIQIRKTDFGEKVDEKKIFELVRNSNQRFFVCSDSAEVEEKFSKLKNCVVNKKSAHAEKSDASKGWNDLIVDDDGRIYPYNVTRSAGSVREALVDFLILSSTTIQPVSGSTFQNLAYRFSAHHLEN